MIPAAHDARISGKEPRLKCPQCVEIELCSGQAAGAQFQQCPQCHGFWLEELELRQLLSVRPRQLVADDRRRDSSRDGAEALSCPRCGGATLIKVNRRESPGTRVNCCTVCFGVWLPPGALSRLCRRGLLERVRRWFTRPAAAGPVNKAARDLVAARSAARVSRSRSH